MYVDTNAEYTITKTSARTGTISEKVVRKKTTVAAMDLVDDARKLSSGTVMEGVYADHANSLKNMANQARKESLKIGTGPVNKSAAKVYENEVTSIKSKLNIAKRNAPVERQAQLVAGTNLTLKRQNNPDLDNDQVRKLRAQALTEARIRLGAKKETIKLTPREWEAIQNNAISTNVLKSVLDNADMDLVRQYATPRDRPVMSDAKIRRAKSMLALGYTQAEIADSIGVPTSTLNDAIK